MKKLSKQKVINVINWVLSITLCSFGICLCTKANFGLSMIAAPPYIIHVKMREIFSWYSQGTSEYIWEAFLFIILCIVIRKFKVKGLLSFATAVFSGVMIDFFIKLFGGNAPYESMAARIICFVIGAPIISLAVAFVFRTTMPPQVYELAVGETAKSFSLKIDRVKLGFDIIMFVISVSLSLILTKGFTGIGIGTVIVTFVNAPMISFFGKLIDKVEKNQAS